MAAMYSYVVRTAFCMLHVVLRSSLAVSPSSQLATRSMLTTAQAFLHAQCSTTNTLHLYLRCSQCGLCMSLCTSPWWWNALWPGWMWVSIHVKHRSTMIQFST